MSTFPRGRRARLGLESFEGITDVAVISITKDAVTFAADLSEEDAAAVEAMLDSTDDYDLACRAAVREARDAVEADPSLENVAALAMLTANYALGDC